MLFDGHPSSLEYSVCSINSINNSYNIAEPADE